ncbi:hypothetical protein [Mycolicibacterium sp. XJ1904]
MRIEGGDPEHPGTRCHKASTGLRASGFREGFERGTLDALRRMWPFLNAEARQAARVIVAELEEAA